MNRKELNSALLKLHQELIALCLKAHEKGIDCFYNYSPHVEWSDIRVYLKGWSPKIDPCMYEDFLWTKMPDDVLDKDIDQSLIDATFNPIKKWIKTIEDLIND